MDSKKEKRFDISMAGKKGLFLRDMLDAKITIPPSFIITTVFNDFIKDARLASKIEAILENYGASLKNTTTLVQVSEEIIDYINSVGFPKKTEKSLFEEFDKLQTDHVAVRHSFIIPGAINIFLKKESASHLNINKGKLIDAIKKAWTSFFTPAALLYKIENNISLENQISLVLVQKMINSDVSGFCLTANPLNGYSKQYVVEASYGIIKEIVDTRGISRDTYVIKKDGFEILGQDIKTQKKMLVFAKVGVEESEVADKLQGLQKLSNKKIEELTIVAKKIEDIYNGVPQRIEWALEKDRFYILGSKPLKKR